MTGRPAVKMYTTAWCGYCAAARDLLRRKGVDFEDIDVDADPEKRREMQELSGRRTVPQVFIGGEPVGGYDDIARLDAEGRLDALLGQPDH